MNRHPAPPVLRHPGEYPAPAWLPGAHAQTIWPIFIKPALPPYRRERWEAPDGDFIDLDWVDGPGEAPLVVLFHGLEGSARSHYARALMNLLPGHGWAGVVCHFRGCSGEPNRLPRAYHSGDSDEIDWVLRRMRRLFPHRAIFATGVSLGGNALLKWLGEQGSAACELVQAAASVSAPLDLTQSGHHLGRGFNLVYTKHFLHTLKRHAAAKALRFPGLFDTRLMARARNLYQFDDVVTAPLHGFLGTDDYWRRASAKPWLATIAAPTLVLHALNDPFLPVQALPGRADVSAPVRLDFPGQGGHVGFVTGPPPGRLDWMPRRLLHFFERGQ